MDSESAHMVTASKVPMLKPENGNTAQKTTVVEGVEKVIPPRTAKEKAHKRLEVKAKSTLMMGIPNEHQLKFNSIKDAKLLLEAIENRLQKLVSQLEILGETLSQEDVNQKLLRSLSPEWNTYVIVWRNKPELETISMDDLYNNLKVTNEAVNTAHGFSAVSTQANAANPINVDNLSDVVICAFIASKPSSPQLANEDLQQLHPDDLEEMDLRWQMAMLTMRERRFLKNTRRKVTINGNETIRESSRKSVPVKTTTSNDLISCDGLGGYDWSDHAEEGPTNYALMAYSSSISDSEVSNDSTYLKSCLKTIEVLKSKYQQLLKRFEKYELVVVDYNTGEITIGELRKKLEIVQKEKDGIQFNVDKFENASKSLNKIIESQIIDNCKKGLGYNAVPPPLIENFMPPKPDLSFTRLEEFTNELVVIKPVVENSEAKVIEVNPKVVRKNNGAPIIKDWVSDSEEENVSQNKIEKKIAKPSFVKIDFVKAKQINKTDRKTAKQVDCNYQRVIKPVWNNAKRVNHQNFAKKTHPCPKKNMVPRAILMKYGLVLVNTARQVNVAHSKTTVNAVRPKPKAIVNVVQGNNVNAIKALACWVWKPKTKVLDHVSKHNSALITLNKFDYVDAQGKSKSDKGVIDSGCSRHMIGNMSYLTDYEEIDGGYVAFGGNLKGGKITGKGTIKTGNLDFENVYFVRELKFTLFSVSQMCDKKNSVLFNESEYIILSPNFKLIDESQVLLRVPIKNHMYSVELKNIVPKGGLTCLFAKATSDESKLWHRRLGHLNFKSMNKLVKGNLPTKDKTSGILKSFITGIENLVDHKVNVIRCDNGTEFKNIEMNQFCEMNGILRQFSVARTLQQNEVAERRNMTLIEAARTMLADSKLQTTFWAEVVNTTCYVQNKVLVVKPYNKTLYEFFHGRTPTLSFMRPFEYPVTILNTIDHLGKFAGKADEGTKANDNAGQARKETESIKNYILLPLWTADSPFSQDPKSSHKEDNVNSTNNVNAASTNEVNVVGGKTSIELPFDPNMPALEDYSIFRDHEDVGAEADMNNLDTTIQIEEEVYVCQPLGFEDPDFPDRVYKVEKALYGLHQAPRACQDKYVDEILKKFEFIEVKTASTPMETQKPLLKDENVYACTRYQVNPKVSHLHAMKRIFSLDRKSTTGEAEYVLLQVAFWSTVKAKTINGEVQLHALVDGKKIIVTESTVRRDLQLEDAEAIDCLPNSTIFEELTRMGYEKISQKLTFYKAFFSPQWIFFIHTILQCLSSKTTAWNEFSSTMASPSGPIDIVADEAVHKELGDSLVRAATTASSLEAKQDSGGGPRCHETMGDTIAQTRFENVSKHSNDSLLARGNTLQSDEDSLKLTELMELCTNLQQRVLDLEKTKTTQQIEIDSLKRRVKSLKRKGEDLGEDASKHGRRINVIYADEDITLVNVQDNVDNEIFNVDTLTGDEVFAEQEVAAKGVNLTVDEVTLAQALTALKSVKPKVKGDDIEEPSVPVSTASASTKVSAATTTTATISTPRKGIVITELAEIDEEERITRAEEEKIDEANIAWDDIQAKVDADYQLTERLLAEEQEQFTIEEKATLFKELLEQRRKHFAAKRAEEKRNKPPTKTQQKKTMITYLKNMEGWKHKDLKSKDFDSLKELFDKAFKRVNMFVEFRTDLVEDEEYVAIDVVPLATKSTKIVGWKIHKEGKKSYYQIMRANGKSQMYRIFSQMIKSFDREDLEDLYKLVKARYGLTRPVEGLDLVLWNDLKNMFEPHVEDTIYMLVEKKYPLTPPTLTQMLEKKIQIDYESEMAYQLFTAALIDVNAAQSKLVLLENFNENYSKCLRLLLKLLLLEEVTTASVKLLLIYKVNAAEGVNAASEEVSTAKLVSTAYAWKGHQSLALMDDSLFIYQLSDVFGRTRAYLKKPGMLKMTPLLLIQEWKMDL
ncbi:ribonuclease H-like domain-containing protein [Tanacetum coccineum]|uniref:Ribonuclease H-like domain-containing protein n=1 Tax=Tanacetum coccineum TaxID=301880 RepID=A0ABQ4ZVT9_9ASTR